VEGLRWEADELGSHLTLSPDVWMENQEVSKVLQGWMGKGLTCAQVTER